ncbi:uncharacterized protein LOC121869233 isoform X2 [Homarus americanus]|uniref:uncharacterized protein LOC121869233 isoform X2 n=1 Tax=Homarus americanus TaxID=6706 RepID=UPI001C48EDAC|nr:uncharacterized protein LOC121869233 isoform X2 [Homarus americanus]
MGGETESPSTSSSPSKQFGLDDEEMMLLSPAATTASSTDSRSSSPEPDQHSADTIKEEELSEVEAVTAPIKKSIFEVEIIDQKRKPKRKAAVEELFQSLKKKRKYEFHGKKEDVPVSPKYPHTSRSATSSPRYQHAVRSTQARKTLTSKKRNRDSICGIEEEGPSMKQAEGSFSGDVPESATCDSPLPPQSTNLVTVELEDGWKKCCTRRTHGTTAGKWDMFYVAPEGKKIRCKNDLHRYCEELGLPFEIEKFDFSVKNMKDAIEAYLKEADSKVTTKTHQPAKDQKELSKDVGLVEVKEEKIEHEDKTAISDPGESSKIHMVKRSEVKKPEVKRLDVKLSDPPRMKIEIPIIPKTENIGMLASPLISPSASPWSPTLTSALPRSLPASAIVHSDEAVKEEPPPPPPPPPAEDTAVGSDLTEETPKFGATPPARQKNILKKEPVLAPNEFVVRAEHNEHQCPKDGCGKGFRKENLLQMHIKHYHPEILKKGSSWAPNVADLAYARTVGDHLDLNASPTPASPPLDKALKQETLSKKISRGVVSGSSTDARNKTGEKKGQGPLKGANTSREIKKKDSLKSETEMTKSMSEDEIEPKEELDDYMDDLEEETPVLRDIVRAEDPDYVPCEVDPLLKKKDKKERKRTRSEAKGKKRKSVPSESMSEDDQQETRAVTKYRYSKRKGSAPPKTNVSATSDPFSSEANLSTSPVKKVQCAEEPTNLEVEEDTTDTWVEGAENVSVQETSAEIINCGCGSTEEEGLMLQCDVCLCWQHGACYNIVGEDQVPDKYICSLCDHPRLERSSHKFRHHQDWLKEGRLPRFSFSRTRGDARLEACVRRGHEMTANVLQLSQVLHSLRLKLHIAKEADHPKFVMWHKKWDEREEDSDQSKAATLANTDTVAPLHELMNIVEQDGSDLSPALTNPLMAEPGLMTTGMSSSDEPGATHATSPVEQDEKPNPSGVWDITGQLINVENFSTNSDAQKPGSADVLQKEPADKKKIKEGDAIDSIKGNSNLSVPSIMSGMPDAEKKESGEGNKIHPVTKFDDAEQSPVSEDKDGSTDSQDQSKIISDKSEGEITLQTKANLTLSEGSSKIYDPQKESLDASEAERDLIENSSTLQTTPDSTELELGNQTGLKPPSKQDNLEDKKTEDSKRIDVVKGSAESNKEISMDITEESTHKDISPIKCSPQCQKLESLKSAKLRETSQQESPSSDNVHPEDCICEEIKLQAEEKKMEAFIKEESTDGSDSSLKDNFKSGIVPEDVEMQSTENEGKTESNKKESNVKTSVSKELITTIINEANTPKSEVEIKPTLKEEKTEADVSVLSEAKAPENYIAEGKITKREDGDDTEIAFENLDEMKSDASKDHCISKDNEDNKMTDIETKDKSKPSLERDEGETEEHKLSEVEMSAVQEPSDINEKEGKQSKDLEGIELPQSSVIDAADISQPQDIEGTEDTLDDDDTQLDDGDDLALDLGGLGAAGEGGMPGGSDLAALLSSQTELEQLVTQASSALAPHVPTAGIVQSVPAPIIPEAERIEPVNCKLNLLEHVQVVQSNITKRFDQIEKQLEVLEAEMGLSADTADEECEEDSEERDPATLQARALIKLILNDVNVVKKIAEFTH